MRLLLVLPLPLRACVPKDFPYGRLYTGSSGGMAPEFPQASPPPFDRQSIGNFIAVDGFGSHGCVKDLYCRFEEERCGWEGRVQDMEEEVRRLRCKGKEDEGHHKDGSRIDPRGNVVINGVDIQF